MPLETFAKRMSQEWREYNAQDGLPVDGDARFPDDMEARNEIIDILSSFSSRDDLARQILDTAQRNDPEYQQQEYERQQKEDYDQQARDLGYKDYDDMIRQQQQAESRQWMESQKTGQLDYQQTPYFAEGWQGTPDRIQQTGVTEAQHQAIFEQGAKAFQTATERAVSEHRAVTLQDFEQAYRERSGQYFDTDRPYLQRYFNHFRDQANRDYKRRLQADQARARGQEPAEHPERIAAGQRRAEAAEAERLQAEQAAQEAQRQAQATTEIPEPDGKTPSLDQARELDNAQRTAANLGLPVIFTDSDNPIHTQGAADAETEATRRGSNAYVFFPEGGGDPRIVVNVDRCKDWNDVYLKTLHEGTAHYGLRQMFGKDYDTFLDNVYDAATDELRAGIDQYLNYNPQYKRDSNGQPIKDEEGRDMRDNLADRRQAVDEYLAHLAEKRPQDLTQPERTLWAKIKEWFISLLRQKGFNIKRLTDEDLIDLLRESHRRLLQQESARRQADNTAPADRTQVLHTSDPGAPEPPAGQTPAEGVDRFGSRVNKRMADISSKLAGMEMDENQRKVVSVFTGESDNESITVQRSDGSTARIIMRKGNEAKGGTKHSLFRHYATSSSPFDAEDVLLIPEVLSKGKITPKEEKGKLLYEYKLQGQNEDTYYVITGVESGREAFVNFYKTRETSSAARRTRSEEARAITDNVSSTGKVTQNSPTDQTNPQQSATEQGKNSYSLPSDTTSEERARIEQERRLPLSQKQKQPGKDHTARFSPEDFAIDWKAYGHDFGMSSPADHLATDTDEAGTTRYSLTKRTRQTIDGWLRKRPDITDEQRQEVLDLLDQSDDTAYQLAAGKWFADRTRVLRTSEPGAPEPPAGEPVTPGEGKGSHSFSNSEEEFDQTQKEASITDRQGNPIDSKGKLITEQIEKIEDITDDDFMSPKRSVMLPRIPENVNNAIGANWKPIIIKKNIFVKNLNHHPDLSAEESRKILNEALYSTNLYGQTQPKTRPNYWVAIRTSTPNRVVVLEVTEKKDNVEIVGWRYAGERQLEELRKQAEREDGQLLILTSDNEAAAGLSTLPSDVSTHKVTQNSPTDQTNPQQSATEQGTDPYSLPEGTTPEERKAYVEEQVGPRLTSRNYGDIKKVNPFFKLLHSDGWRTWVPYRDVFKTPTVDDYYIGTKTTFTSIGAKPDGDNVTSLLEAEAENKKTWQQMKDSGKYEWHKSPLSDSEYLVDRQTGDIYRFSDHWFRVASCDWAIDDFHANESLKGIYQIGKSNIKDFELNDRAKGNQVVQNPENRKPYEDALNETIANYEALLGSNVDMTRIAREEAEKALRQYKQLRDEVQNSGKMATGNQVRYSLPLQPANDPALTPEQNRLLSPESLIKLFDNGDSAEHYCDEALGTPYRHVAWGDRLTSFGRFNERRRKEGLQLDFDIQGNLVSYGLYHDGRREGMHYTFNAFGEKLSEGEFRNGTPVGTHRLWRDYDMISGYNGKDYDRHAYIIRERTDKHPYLVVNYNEQGKRQGDSWRYDENGKPMTRSIWNNGRRVAEWYDKGYIQQVVNHPEEYDTSADAALWRRRMARKHGSTPWIPLGQPGEGQPYKPAEQTGKERPATAESQKPLHQWDPIQAVKENKERRQESQLTISFPEEAAPSNLSDPSDPSYNPAATHKDRQMPPSMLTDEELLLRTRTEEGSTDDWNLFNDEYDRRHRQEYADLTDHYRDVIEKTSPTLDDAYDMLATADQHFHYGGYASTERTELLAQRDVLQDYIDRKEAEQAEAEMGTDRYSLPEDQQRTDDIITAAKKHFGTTRDIREAGYILPDGKLLDFSGRHELEPGTSDRPVRGQRTSDHRDIRQIAYDKDDNPTGITTDMADFIRRGAIRIDANNGAVNLAVKPTAQQRRRIRELVARNEGDIYIDFGDGDNTDHYAEYEGAKPTRILADIDRYFDEGIKPEGVTRYSLPMETHEEVKKEKEQIEKRAKNDGTWMKAPNAKDTKLDGRQWTEVRTTPFKEWYGDWELAERGMIIANLVPVKEVPLAKGETYESAYKKIGSATNRQENITVTFFNSAYKKIAKAGGLSEQSIPMLKKCFEESVFAYSEPDNQGGTTRPDGTIHKVHPNIEEFRNFIGKMMIGGQPHYVRFTVQVQKGSAGLHSYFVTDINVYTNTANSLSVPNLLRPRGTVSGVVDAKLQNFFQSANNAAKNSSKIVDGNGEPLVVYHQTDADFTVFDPHHPGSGTNDHHLPFGIFLKPTKSDIGMRGKKQMPLYANIKNPLVVADRNSLTQYLRENVEGYSELLNRYNNIDKEYKAKFDEASERSRTKYTELWHQWKDGKISEDEYQRGIDDREEEAILKEWKEAGNKLSAEMKKLVDGHFRSSDYDGIILENDEGSFGRSTKTILAFDENQVKSATDNIGTFSPSNGDIRFSLPGGNNTTPTPATGPTRGIDLTSWDPLASARQHVTDSRQARAEADQAWTDHRQRREQAIASHTAVKNDPNLTPGQKNRLQNDMIRRVADVRALVSKVREGDRESVKAVTQTVLDLADAVGDGLTRGAVKRLMHAVENATTRRDVKTEVDKAVDVILTQVTRETQRQTEKLLHTKATKLDPNNIRVAGQMDEHGQRSLRQLNELLSPEGQATDLDQLEAELTDKEQNGRELAFSLLSKNYLSKYYKISQKKLT